VIGVAPAGEAFYFDLLPRLDDNPCVGRINEDGSASILDDQSLRAEIVVRGDPTHAYWIAAVGLFGREIANLLDGGENSERRLL
jgi:hypothetical protein